MVVFLYPMVKRPYKWSFNTLRNKTLQTMSNIQSPLTKFCQRVKLPQIWGYWVLIESILQIFLGHQLQKQEDLIFDCIIEEMQDSKQIFII